MLKLISDKLFYKTFLKILNCLSYLNFKNLSNFDPILYQGFHHSPFLPNQKYPYFEGLQYHYYIFNIPMITEEPMIFTGLLKLNVI